MDFIELKTGNDDISRRLDKVIRRFLPDEALSSVYKLLRKGLIKVNHQKKDASYHIEQDDVICIASFLLENKIKNDKQVSPAKPLPEEWILFRNDYLLIINKPYNIPVQKSADCTVSLDQMVREDYRYYHPEDLSLSFKTGPLHRLDKKTTGALVFSQNLTGARWFSSSIAEHTTVKIYLGLVQGKMDHSEKWEDLIEKNDENKGFMTVKAGGNSGKAAYTEASPLAYGMYNGNPVTLVKYIIKTGRTHQIRSQTSLHGYPLLGDTAYKGRKLYEDKTDQEFFLHAWKLIPEEQNPCGLKNCITAPITPAFEKILSESLIKGLDKLIL